MNYISSFNWKTQLKQIKTYITTIRTRPHNSKIRDECETIINKRDLRVIYSIGEIKVENKVQPATVTSLATKIWHVHHRVKEDMTMHSMRYRTNIFIVHWKFVVIGTPPPTILDFYLIMRYYDYFIVHRHVKDKKKYPWFQG